jgi:preprotein translocase subunit SecE
MSKFQEKTRLAKAFIDDVVAETRKTTWPERQELVESTMVVIVAVLLLSAFVGVSDKVLVVLLKLLINMG